MKLHKSYLRILLLLLLVFLPKVASADSNKHYQVKVTVSVKESPAKGTVYVSDKNNATSGSKSLTLDSTNDSGGTLTFYLYGKPDFGYELKGWYEDDSPSPLSNSTTSPYIYQKAAPKTETTDPYSLKASFELIPYDITYVKNGGEWSTPGLTSYTYETSSISLPKNMTKDESKFTGWTISGSNHNWGASIDPNVTSITGPKKYGNVTLTAGWETKTYTAEFYDGNQKLTDLSTSYNKAGGLTMPEYSKNYYDFQYWELVYQDGQGWNEDQYNKGVKYSDRNGNVKFKAVWTPTPYYITYVPVGGTLNPNSTTQEYNYETNPIVLYGITKDESNFTGWTVTSTGDHNWYSPIESETSSISGSKYGNVTLTAGWETKKYTITYLDDDGSSLAPPSGQTWPSTFTKASGFILPTPTKDHYTFSHWVVFGTNNQGGWTDGTTYDKDHLTIASNTKNADVTFKAVWTPTPYTITYDPVGGTLEPNSTTQEYTYKTNPITLHSVTKEESTFTGWTVAATDDSPNDWPTTGKITSSSIAGPHYGNVTLTATWNVTTYEVKFYDSDGNTLLKNLLPNAYSKADGFEFPSYSKTGYTVDYWEVKGTPGGGWDNNEASTEYVPGKTVTGKNADVSFKAHYKLDTYTITYNPNGGEVTQTTGTYDFENDFTLSVPEKAGCVFKGWKPEVESGSWVASQLYSGTIKAGTAHGNVTLIAQWIGGLVVEIVGGDDVSEDCYAVFKVSGGGVEYLISVSKGHPETLESLENGKTYTVEPMDWHKAYTLDSNKRTVEKVDDEQTVTFTATKATRKVSDTYKNF